jgi:S-adenosyl methyltransferase
VKERPQWAIIVGAMTLCPVRRSEEGAVTEDWMKGWAEGIEPPAEIDTTVAHQSRIYDYWLGGKDNTAADRPKCGPAVK